MVVQHNLTAMNSNRMLNMTTKTQSKSTEKLSSGYKINRAADDAAGLSISEKMRKQIRGLTQASANAQDGISMVQTAEGALNEVQDMLQRMNELAVKAANGTLSSDDRAYVQNEVDALITEMDRVGETTKFNETYLLKGTSEKITSPFSGRIDESILGENTDLLNNHTLGIHTGTEVSDICGATIVHGQNGTDNTVSASMAAGFVDLSAVATKADVEKLYGCGFSATCTACSCFYSVKFVDDGGNFKVGGVQVDSLNANGYKAVCNEMGGVTLAVDISDCSNGKEVVNKVLSAYANYNGTTYGGGKAAYNMGASLNGQTPGVIDDVSTSWHHVGIGGNDATGQLVLMDTTSTNATAGTEQPDDYKGSGGFQNGYVGGSGYMKNTAQSLNLHVGADATSNNQIEVKLGHISKEALGFVRYEYDWRSETNNGWKNVADVTTQDSALKTIGYVGEAIQKVSTMRSAFGAIQNRLEHTINNLDNVVENTTAAESAIRDTDMASEMVKYSNNNILAQAGQAMLAQANQSNQGVLSLLG